MQDFTKKVFLFICLIFLIFSEKGYTATTVHTDSDGSVILRGENDEGMITHAISASGTFASIIVDGDPSDWDSIPVLITDPEGDAGPYSDIISIKVANDENFVFILEEFAIPPPDDTFLFLDTDLNPTTGCIALGIGSEYVINFLIPSGGFIGDVRNCSTTSGDFPGSLVYVVADNFIEASIPISTLEVLSPGLTAFDITAANDLTIVARYNFSFCKCDVSGDGTITPQDALCAFQKYLGICPTACDPCEDICCDVNRDDNCTPSDALCIFQEYLGIECEYCEAPDECPCPDYVEQASYTGDCQNRPPGTVCIGYSDGYIWLVEDAIQGWRDEICNDQPVSIAIGFKDEYHHILHTNCVKQVSY